MNQNQTIKFFRTNWLAIVLAAVIIYLLTRPSSPLPLSRTISNTKYASTEMMSAPAQAPGRGVVDSFLPPVTDPAPTDTDDRLTIIESSLSLLVDSVSETLGSVQTIAESNRGYLVNSHLSQPEGGATGTITIRVPIAARDLAMSEIKALGIRVVSETTYGRDVTDQYVDIEAHLETLTKTKAKFEAILDSATTVQDSLAVQQELVNLQRQIDSYLGQQKYLEGNAELSKITVSLATDELALPYTPDEPWRPAAIFKTAVRSLVQVGRGAISLAIWVLVYSPAWLIAAAVYWRLSKRRR